MCTTLILVVTTSTPERQDGITLLQEAIAKIEETIKKLGGSFNVQMAVSFLKLTNSVA